MHGMRLAPAAASSELLSEAEKFIETIAAADHAAAAGEEEEGLDGAQLQGKLRTLQAQVGVRDSLAAGGM